MMNNNKILTVSYGTFSCTLEGFDDSFDTMKAIAEYFRDLASDDRYFGAEPPQPDAEMLARIAEREVSRRVEAREHEGHFMLKAHEDAATAAPAPITAATAPSHEDDIATQEPATAAPVPAQHVAVEQEAVSDIAAPALMAVEDEEVFSEAPLVDQNTQEDETVASEIHAEDVVARPPSSDALSDRLARIRAVVSQQNQTGFAQNGYEDDIGDTSTPAQSFEDMSFFNAAPVVADQTDLDDETTPHADEKSQDKSEHFETEDSEMADFAQNIQDALTEDDRLAAEAIEAFESEEDDLQNILNQIDADAEDEPGDEALMTLAATEEDFAALSGDFEADADENMFTENVISGTFDEDLDALDETPELSTEPGTTSSHRDDADAHISARVLKMDSETLDSALENGVLAEVSGDTSADLPETETAPEDALSKPAARDSLPKIGSETDVDVSRLMAEADHQMEEPEAATRRSAFEHLRAAVAARFADKSMDSTSEEEETTQAFRSDLAEVVKPRRTVSEGIRTERLEEISATPLKLVAEQRVNQENALPTGTIAPRRVAASVHDDFEPGEHSGFATFAQEMGATKLPDLLEAAAAYMAFVEGHEHFSRPQLMTRVRQAEGGDFSREAGLRSFGQLLRTGKIEKMSGGRFAASDEIGFKPNQRAAG